MSRLIAWCVVVLLVGPVGQAWALRIAFVPPGQRLIAGEVVVIGKVQSIEKATAEVEAAPGEPKSTYHIALVKIENALKGADSLTHLKVGFTPLPESPRPGEEPNVRPGSGAWRFQQLKEGQEMVFFLFKHPQASFYVIDPLYPPIDLSQEHEKKQLETLKKMAVVIRDPKAALTAQRAEDRYFAAFVLIMHYRQFPRQANQPEQVPLPRQEQELILQGLLEGDWDAEVPGLPNGVAVFGMLGLGPKDGFIYPKLKPGEKIGNAFKKAFADWLQGPGKDYVIRRFSPAQR